MSDIDPRLEIEPDIPSKKRRRGAWIVFALIAGVFLPVVAISVEMMLRVCSSIFFDPIPTVWHIIPLAIVPLANLTVIWAWRRNDYTITGPLSFFIGIAVGTECIYSLQFLPLAPISLVGIICLGMGLCGLSPFLGLASSIICRVKLRDLDVDDHGRHGRIYWAGILAGTVPLALYFASTYITVSGLRMAASPDAETSRRGVRLIRAFGSKSALLRACYQLPTAAWSVTWWNTGSDTGSVSRDQARTVYYKVTGCSFNSVPPPRMFGNRSRFVSDFELDSDVGGTAVNSRVTSLSLSSSRMDAVVYPDELTAYTEWTMMFTNSSSVQKEARAEVALPPGGVVSRLTLWVDGEEREAAFAARGKVREAYQKVAVVQRRDPVLVTTCGPDRVLVQCFPVPPDGGTMKIRVGITTPLIAYNYSKAIFTLPCFVERNFGIQDGIEHSLFIESPKGMVFSGSSGSKESHCIRTILSDEELRETKSAILCSRDSNVRRTWVPDSTDPDRYAIVQTLAEADPRAPDHLILVIDGSGRMAGSVREVASVLKNLPERLSFSVIWAGDSAVEMSPMRTVSRKVIEQARERILGMRCVGGIDNRPALVQALDTADANKNSVVLWVHGPQPLVSNALTEQMMQLLERRRGSFRILSVTATDGRNSILADLERTGAVEVVPRAGSLASDLRKLFSEWSGSQTLLAAYRERVPIGEVGNMARASSHLWRLWVRDEVIRMCRLADSRMLSAAARLAARYQLVTSVSGAVVLENEQQYEEVRLKAVDAASVPTIPEPAGWIALAMGVALILRRLRD